MTTKQEKNKYKSLCWFYIIIKLFCKGNELHGPAVCRFLNKNPHSLASPLLFSPHGWLRGWRGWLLIWPLHLASFHQPTWGQHTSSLMLLFFSSHHHASPYFPLLDHLFSPISPLPPWFSLPILFHHPRHSTTFSQHLHRAFLNVTPCHPLTVMTSLYHNLLFPLLMVQENINIGPLSRSKIRFVLKWVIEFNFYKFWISLEKP